MIWSPIILIIAINVIKVKSYYAIITLQSAKNKNFFNKVSTSDISIYAYFLFLLLLHFHIREIFLKSCTPGSQPLRTLVVLEEKVPFPECRANNRCEGVRLNEGKKKAHRPR